MRPNKSIVEKFLEEESNQAGIHEQGWSLGENIDIAWPAGFEAGYTLRREEQSDRDFRVAFAEASARPTASQLRATWAAGRGKSCTGLLIAVLYDDKAAIVGPREDDEPVSDITIPQAESVLRAALQEASPNSAVQRARGMLEDLRDDSATLGVTNSGLFASNELFYGLPRRADWESACSHGAELLHSEGKDLFFRLGFRPEHGPNGLTYLKEGDDTRAVAALLHGNERFDQVVTRFNSELPVRLAQRIAREEDIDWVIVQAGRQLRLYPTRIEQPVSKGTLTDRYLQLDLAQLEQNEAGYLSLLFSPDSLAPQGTVNQILESSRIHVVNLIDRLKERVYADVIPGLAVGVANALEARSKDELDEAYHRSLVILFRLIFLAYAEDEGLLPYKLSESYRAVSITALARELTDNPEAYRTPNSYALWERLELLWAAVDKGNPDLNVPAYNGGLFRPEGPNPRHPWTRQIALTDKLLAPVLTALLVDTEMSGRVGAGGGDPSQQWAARTG